MKSIGKNTKRVLWNDKSVAGRFTIAGTLIATGGLSGQSAEIAALGRAIGVPLWLVVAGGSSLLGTITQEISASLKCALITEYETIEGRKKPGKEAA
ncbi:MAG: hypothetical protein DSZ28_00225 [Thiothrix sp.]|nr:MAG: hypothetical protein DSZ28_00225 [Thiothrix sp.]